MGFFKSFWGGIKDIGISMFNGVKNLDELSNNTLRLLSSGIISGAKIIAYILGIGGTKEEAEYAYKRQQAYEETERKHKEEREELMKKEEKLKEQITALFSEKKHQEIIYEEWESRKRLKDTQNSLFNNLYYVHLKKIKQYSMKNDLEKEMNKKHSEFLHAQNIKEFIHTELNERRDFLGIEKDYREIIQNKFKEVVNHIYMKTKKLEEEAYRKNLQEAIFKRNIEQLIEKEDEIRNTINIEKESKFDNMLNEINHLKTRQQGVEIAEIAFKEINKQKEDMEEMRECMKAMIESIKKQQLQIDQNKNNNTNLPPQLQITDNFNKSANKRKNKNKDIDDILAEKYNNRSKESKSWRIKKR